MSFDRDDAIGHIADHVHELVDARRHIEPHWRWTASRHRKLHKHVTDQPSLLDQLRAQLPPGGPESDADGPIGSAGARTSLPLAVDVLDALLRVESESVWWASVKLRRDLRDTVEDNLRLLVGASTRMEDHELKPLAKDVAHWHSTAATLTGWQSPPFTPRAPCPFCARMGTLRINPDQKRGLCVECQATWQEADGSIGLLADQIRQADPAEMRLWEVACDHSWRLTTVGTDGVRAQCLDCHMPAVRPSWPKGTPVFTDLDERMRGASA